MGTVANTPSLADDLYLLVITLHRNCQRDLFDAITREHLSFNQLRLLGQLRHGRIRPTVSQAASLLHLSKPATSRSVDELARAGLLHREADRSDDRAKRLVITERGEAVLHRLDVARATGILAFCNRLAPDTRTGLQRALAPVLGRADPQPKELA